MAINHKIKKIIFFAFGLVFGMIVMYFIVNQFLNNKGSFIVKKHVELSGFILGEKYIGKGNSIPSRVAGYSCIIDISRLYDNRIFMIEIQLATEPSDFEGLNRIPKITDEQLNGFWRYFENQYNITLKQKGDCYYQDEVDGVSYHLYYLNSQFNFYIIDDDLRKISYSETEPERKKMEAKRRNRDISWERLSKYIAKFNSQQNNTENGYRLQMDDQALSLCIPLIAYSYYAGVKPDEAADLLLESSLQISLKSQPNESSNIIYTNARPALLGNAGILDEFVKNTFHQMNFQKSIIEDINEIGVLYYRVVIEHPNGHTTYSNELKFDGTWK